MRSIFLLTGLVLGLAATSLAVPGEAQASTAQEAASRTDMDVSEAPPKLTKQQEQALRLSSLRFAAQEAERRGDLATALAHYVRAVTVAPNDVGMLSAAGRLALEANDPKAAFGFLVRAASFAPRDRQIMVMLGRALVNDNRARDGLRIFERASRLGADEEEFADDRGLARDLTGEQRRAQRDYALALAKRPDDLKVQSRLALSLAISGDRANALAALQPLGNKRDSGIQRTIAFTYALLGDTDRAMAIVRAWMPGSTSDGMLSFINRLPRLNAGEKARAVHFGELPPDDTPPASAMAHASPPRDTTAGADAGASILMLKPNVAADGKAAAPSKPTTTRSAARQTPAEPVETPDASAMCASIKGAAAKQRCEASQRALAKRCAARTSRPTAECVAFAKQTAETPPTKAEVPAKAASLAPANAGEVALAACGDIKADGARRTCETNARALARRCVARPNTAECKLKADVAEAKPAEEPATPEAICATKTGDAARRQCEIDARALARRCAGQKVKTAECLAADRPARASAPKVAPNPARYWVQVASGANRKDLPKEWDRLKSAHASALKSQKPSVASNGRSNRLVIGPFKDAAAARTQVNKLSAGGLSAFSWQSDAGEEVEALSGS